MYCVNCGKEVPKQEKNCPGCGESNPFFVQPHQSPPVAPTPSSNYHPQQPYQSPPTNNYYPQQPYFPQTGGGYQNPALHPMHGKAIGALVCSLIGILIAGIIFGTIGLFLGISAKGWGYRGGLATAAVVIGIIDIVFSIIHIVIFVGKDCVDRFLRKVVKGGALRNNIPKQRVVFLDVRLLA